MCSWGYSNMKARTPVLEATYGISTALVCNQRTKPSRLSSPEAIARTTRSCLSTEAVDLEAVEYEDDLHRSVTNALVAVDKRMVGDVQPATSSNTAATRGFHASARQVWVPLHPSSIRRRLLHAIDDQHGDGLVRRLQSQAELLLKSREDREARIGRHSWRRGPRWRQSGDRRAPQGTTALAAGVRRRQVRTPRAMTSP